MSKLNAALGVVFLSCIAATATAQNWCPEGELRFNNGRQFTYTLDSPGLGEYLVVDVRGTSTGSSGGNPTMSSLSQGSDTIEIEAEEVRDQLNDDGFYYGWNPTSGTGIVGSTANIAFVIDRIDAGNVNVYKSFTSFYGWDNPSDDEESTLVGSFAWPTGTPIDWTIGEWDSSTRTPEFTYAFGEITYWSIPGGEDRYQRVASWDILNGDYSFDGSSVTRSLEPEYIGYTNSPIYISSDPGYVDIGSQSLTDDIDVCPPDNSDELKLEGQLHYVAVVSGTAVVATLLWLLLKPSAPPSLIDVDMYKNQAMSGAPMMIQG